MGGVRHLRQSSLSNQKIGFDYTCLCENEACPSARMFREGCLGRVDVARGLRSDEVSCSSGCHGRYYYITYCVTNVYCPSEMSIRPFVVDVRIAKIGFVHGFFRHTSSLNGGIVMP